MRTGYISEVFSSFQGEGALVGKRHLFIRSAGCHLRCRYCDTPESLERTPAMVVRRRGATLSSLPNPVTVDQLVSVVTRMAEFDGLVDGVALTGGEPLLQSEFLAELLANETIPHPRLLETSGTHPERLPALLPLIDVVSMDLKLPSNSSERPLWSSHERFLAAARGKVYVKVLIDAGTELADVTRAGVLIRSTAPETAVFLQPITAKDGQVDLGEDQLNIFFAEARRYVDDVRVVPQVHKLLCIA